MKRTIAVITISLLAFCLIGAAAEDLGVQIIGGDGLEVQTLDLSDVQLGETYEISGYARVTPISFEFVETFPYYEEGYVGDNTTESNAGGGIHEGIMYNKDFYSDFYSHLFFAESGTNADYAFLLTDITNLKQEPVYFMKEAEVKVVFDNNYEYQGWCRQFNYDYDSSRPYEGTYGSLIRGAIGPEDEEAVDIVYTGHYVFGCTLPNAVVSGQEPLRMVVTLGGNEITYNIRK